MVVVDEDEDDVDDWSTAESRSSVDRDVLKTFSLFLVVFLSVNKTKRS